MGAWVRACGTNDVKLGNVARFDQDGQTFIIIRSTDDEYYFLEGNCTHKRVNLCDGLMMDGIIECSKQNVHFDYRKCESTQAPSGTYLKTVPVEIDI